MTSVKDFYAEREWHAPLLMGLLLREVAQVFADGDWNGLRQSHFRVISAVPVDGITITELGDRVGMTKQGCGQFVTALTEAGYLQVGGRPTDRRTRIVSRTALGGQTVQRVQARIIQLEREWASQVGDDRYRVFRDVLQELATEVRPAPDRRVRHRAE